MIATPGQTIGPFFGFALPYDGGPDLVPADDPRALRLRGHVYDGAGDPVPDALLELSQADASLTGWGRAATDPTGAFAFTTVRPAAAYVGLTVFARGLLDRLFTRVYLPDAGTGTVPDVADDALLRRLDPARRATLLAHADGADLVFDVHLQGEHETVFLRYPGHRRD